MPCMMVTSALLLLAPQTAPSSAHPHSSAPTCPVPSGTSHCVASHLPPPQPARRSILIAGYSVELNIAPPEEYIANSTAPAHKQRAAAQEPLHEGDAYAPNLLDEPWTTTTITHTHTAHATVHMTLPPAATARAA